MNSRNQIPEYVEGKEYVFYIDADYDECPRCGDGDEAFVVGMFEKDENNMVTGVIFVCEECLLVFDGYVIYYTDEQIEAMERKRNEEEGR